MEIYHKPIPESIVNFSYFTHTYHRIHLTRHISSVQDIKGIIMTYLLPASIGQFAVHLRGLIQSAEKKCLKYSVKTDDTSTDDSTNDEHLCIGSVRFELHNIDISFRYLHMLCVSAREYTIDRLGTFKLRIVTADHEFYIDFTGDIMMLT